MGLCCTKRTVHELLLWHTILRRGEAVCCCPHAEGRCTLIAAVNDAHGYQALPILGCMYVLLCMYKPQVASAPRCQPVFVAILQCEYT